MENIQTTMEVKRVNIYYMSDKDSMQIIEKNNSIEHDVNMKYMRNDKKFIMTLRYVPAKYDGMSISRLIITPKIPTWINQWSTNYDGSDSYVNKTYALESFTHNLLKITNDNQFILFSVYFIL
jgi:hypothetical protein